MLILLIGEMLITTSSWSRRMCVVIDLVATLLLEAKDKLTFAQEAFEDKTGLMLFIMLMVFCKRS
jgi:hypothetical protein